MACYHPLEAYRSPDSSEPGKFKYTFKRHPGWHDKVFVPCGQCSGCRLERSRQWAVRIMHETQFHSSNCFLTLTYSNDHLPADCGLVKKHLQNFIRFLRRHFASRKLRFFACGEYGEKGLRPHYHAIIFGIDHFDFEDSFLFSQGSTGDLYSSPTLDQIWKRGYCTIGSVTFESAAYVARYCLKKITGNAASKHYERFDSESGEIFSVIPEFVLMSLKPGIGRFFIEKFRDDIYPSDQVIVRGKAMRPPRYYDRVLEKFSPCAIEEIKGVRLRKASSFKGERTPERLKVRERVANARILNRKLES